MADDDDNAEEWRFIPGFEDYEVSSFGRVRRALNSTMKRGLLPGGILRPWLSGFGYPCVSLGARHKFYIHRLVALVFIGPSPDKTYEVAHYDGNKINNRLENLRWVTHTENESDKKRHGTNRRASFKGAEHPRAKLTEKDVLAIRTMVHSGISRKQVAEQYSVNYSTIGDIVRRRSWSHLADE